jgi:cobalt/nickel transport protein
VTGKNIILGFLIAIALAIFISPLASSFPDGLEKVAEKLGFIEKGEGEPLLNSPVPDYLFPRIKNEKMATAVAGVGGTIIVFGLTYGLAKLIKRTGQK